jgi:hypothetical protein
MDKCVRWLAISIFCPNWRCSTLLHLTWKNDKNAAAGVYPIAGSLLILDYLKLLILTYYFKSAAIGIDGENNSLFTITVDGKTFHMQVIKIRGFHWA